MAQDERNVGKTIKEDWQIHTDIQNSINKKFLSALWTQMVPPGAIEKVDGFVGRKDAKASQTQIYVLAEIGMNTH